MKRNEPEIGYFYRWAVLPDRAKTLGNLYRHLDEFSVPVKTFRTRREAQKAAKTLGINGSVAVRKVEMQIID